MATDKNRPEFALLLSCLKGQKSWLGDCIVCVDVVLAGVCGVLFPTIQNTIQNHKKSHSDLTLSGCFYYGAPGAIRTPDLRIRSPLLYPAELQARWEVVLYPTGHNISTFFCLFCACPAASVR